MLGAANVESFEPAIRALGSALLRELDTWSVVEREGRAHVELPLPDSGGAIELPLARPAGVGRLAILAARRRDAHGVRPLAPAELIATLVGEPSFAAALGLEGDPARADRLIARVRASTDAMHEVIEARVDELDHLAADPLGFVEAEQGLLLGHSVHPAPRMREGLPADARASVPELRGRVQLCAWAVTRARWIAQGDRSAIAELIAGDPAWADASAGLPDDQALIVVHPLQHRALLDDPALHEARRRGELRPLGPLGRLWAPTSSLRTLHGEAAWMLKTSLPIRLTNSRRSLARAELERGLIFDRVLALPELVEFAARRPSLSLLREPAYVGLRDDHGHDLAASFVALRENHFAAGQPVEVLATLLADDPRSGLARVARRLRERGQTGVDAIDRWFAAYLERVLTPIVELAVEHGVLLSAHQQNLVIGFESDGLTPARGWFRDAQGTAYSALARQRFGERVPGLEQALFRSPLAERAWAYSVVINGVFNVIASLAQLPGVGQAGLLDRLRACLLDLRERGSGDPRVLASLLDAPELWTKANVRAFASGVDEVDLPDPLAIYRPIANPLARPAGQASDPTLTRGRAANYAHARAEIELVGDRGVVELEQGRVTFELVAQTGERVRLRWTSATEVGALVSDWLFATRPQLRMVEHEHAGARTLDLRESFWQRGGVWQGEGEGTLLYRRHCAAIDRTFALHRFELAHDLDRLCAWMNDPVVAEFWEQAWPRERLREYVSAKLADPHVVPAIGWFDDRPFAYFEIYRAKHDRLGPHYAVEDHDRGFHMAVGEPGDRHRGLGRQWFMAMAHYLFLADPDTQRLVGEPRIDQARVRAWATSTAWQAWGEIQFPHKRALLMVLTRERMFASFEGAA